ncbi:ABC transporter permease subunit [Cyanobacterium aponinum AL20118]|uniref:ABC transporter permease subunit n=1 Tax=Cyanobacterium aponinum AL20115 TaxID=3090662 RepID=A0AAF1C567_9CHRO|nr:ABC transporter permease subunit [Cyanobacterium aponinum]WPF88240.1 ABC transporter permease subunit [Cyanobacterium aponinum AL20115]
MFKYFFRHRKSKVIIFGFLIFVCVLLTTFNPFEKKSFANESISFTVGTEPTFPPLEMPSATGNGLEGFDIDLMNAIGKEVGLNIVFESMPFDGLIPALQSNTIDAAIGGITITPERAKSVRFSSPYFKAGLAIAVQQSNEVIKNYDDLKGKKIAVAIGTTGAIAASKIPNAQVITFDSAVLALQELVNGKVDAVLNDTPVTLYAIKDAGLQKIKIVGTVEEEEYYGIILPNNSDKLALINYGLYEILRNGNYKAIYRKWFSGEPTNLPIIAPSLISSANSSSNNTQNNPNLTNQPLALLLIQKLPQGALVTITLTSFSIFFGLIGGSLIAFGLISRRKILKTILRIYVEFFRGTPMLVQLFIIYFGLPAFFQGIGLSWSLQRFPAAIIALSLNVTAYLAEIIRGGIESIDSGQWEACESLGMNYWQTMKEVILPQAFRRILPPLGNEFITLIKDTSLVAVIGFAELFRQGQLIVATTYQSFAVYITVALVYLCLTTLSSFIFKWTERRLKILN